MNDLALHLLDIVQNSLVAGATFIKVYIGENPVDNQVTMTVEDNGKGMTPATTEKDCRIPFLLQGPPERWVWACRCSDRQPNRPEVVLKSPRNPEKERPCQSGLNTVIWTVLQWAICPMRWFSLSLQIPWLSLNIPTNTITAVTV